MSPRSSALVVFSATVFALVTACGAKTVGEGSDGGPESDSHSQPIYVDSGVETGVDSGVEAGVDSGAETAPLYPPDAGFTSSLYLMSCLTGNAEGDPSKAFMQVATITYAPVSGGGGTITFGGQYLVANPTSLSNVTGMYYQATPANAPVAADGTATVTWGATTLPGNANPATGMNITFTSSTLDLHVESETQICGNFSGNVSMPVITVISGPCLFRLLPSASSPIPSLNPGDFHCP